MALLEYSVFDFMSPEGKRRDVFSLFWNGQAYITDKFTYNEHTKDHYFFSARVWLMKQSR